MILYFSGTGNSEFAAKKIGNEIQDDVFNLFTKIRDRDFSDMHSDRPWVIAAPTYAWRIPRILQEWLSRTKLNGCRDLYFVMTCGGNMGNAGAYLKKLCASKDMNYMGAFEVVMPENYIALFTSPDDEEARNIISQSERRIIKAAQLIKNHETFPLPQVTVKDRLDSGIVNDIFYPLFVHAKKFYSTSGCISCGKCEKVCPLKNIRIDKGRPVWGKDCTHCMACISRCPKEAIEYGQHSKGLVRYTFPKDLY